MTYLPRGLKYRLTRRSLNFSKKYKNAPFGLLGCPGALSTFTLPWDSSNASRSTAYRACRSNQSVEEFKLHSTMRPPFATTSLPSHKATPTRIIPLILCSSGHMRLVLLGSSLSRPDPLTVRHRQHAFLQVGLNVAACSLLEST